MKKNYKKFIFIGIGVLITLVAIVGYFWYDFKMKEVRISDGQAERRDPIPKELQGSQIVLNVPMYYRIGSPRVEKTKTIRSIGRRIVPKVEADTPWTGMTYELIPNGMKFTVTGILFVGYTGFRVFGSGDPGEFLLLRDENGIMSYMNFGDLRWNTWISGKSGPSLASYYKNGVLVGGVDKIDFREWDAQAQPRISFWQIMFGQ